MQNSDRANKSLIKLVTFCQKLLLQFLRPGFQHATDDFLVNLSFSDLPLSVFARVDTRQSETVVTETTRKERVK